MTPTDDGLWLYQLSDGRFITTPGDVYLGQVQYNLDPGQFDAKIIAFYTDHWEAWQTYGHYTPADPATIALALAISTHWDGAS